VRTRLRSAEKQDEVAENERREREDRRRQQRVAHAMRAGWPELPRSDLSFGRFVVEHVPSGNYFKPMGGEVIVSDDAVAAFFVDADGDAVLLERPTSGPRSRPERDDRARPAKPAPKPRRIRAGS
jgi:hypothetical protein